ncbi:MAG: response regulator [Solirubrobacterales bacterium]|nr:response regulator [Solirubrobacterales bacterium]
MPVRCLIIDDNAAFVAAARSVLNGDNFKVVGGATTVSEARRQIRELAPEVVLVDIDLGEESGFALARQLAEDGGGDRPRLILVSTHPEDEFADLIADSPAVGFLAKSELSAARLSALLNGGAPGSS